MAGIDAAATFHHANNLLAIARGTVINGKARLSRLFVITVQLEDVIFRCLQCKIGTTLRTMETSIESVAQNLKRVNVIGNDIRYLTPSRHSHIQSISSRLGIGEGRDDGNVRCRHIEGSLVVVAAIAVPRTTNYCNGVVVLICHNDVLEYIALSRGGGQRDGLTRYCLC